MSSSGRPKIPLTAWRNMCPVVSPMTLPSEERMRPSVIRKRGRPSKRRFSVGSDGVIRIQNRKSCSGCPDPPFLERLLSQVQSQKSARRKVGWLPASSFLHTQAAPTDARSATYPTLAYHLVQQQSIPGLKDAILSSIAATPWSHLYSKGGLTSSSMSSSLNPSPNSA